MTVVTIVGAGNGGHVLAALAGQKVTVRILTRRPDIFASRLIAVERPDIGPGVKVESPIAAVSSRPEEVLPGSDVVIWCGPVIATRQVFEQLAPHLARLGPRPPLFGCLFGQGCIHLLARQIFGAHVPFFCFQNIPWLCRTLEPGRLASIVGSKEYTNVACHLVEFAELRRVLEPLLGGPVMAPLADFAAIVLNPANQIIHPARYWGIFHAWDFVSPIPKEQIPSLYGDFDDISAEALEGLDAELQALKQHLHRHCPQLDLSHVKPLAQRIIDQYGDQVRDKSCMKTIMATNQAYSKAQTPVVPAPGGGSGVHPNPNHRVVQDDIPHGLCVLIDLAEHMNVPVPWMVRMVEWHQRLMGKEYLVNGRFVGRDIAETSALSVLGGTDLLNIGLVTPKPMLLSSRL